MKWTYKNFVIFILNTKEINNKYTYSRSPRIQTLSAGIMHTARLSPANCNNLPTSTSSKAPQPRSPTPARPLANKHSRPHAPPPYSHTTPPSHHTPGSSAHTQQQIPAPPHCSQHISGQALPHTASHAHLPLPTSQVHAPTAGTYRFLA